MAVSIKKNSKYIKTKFMNMLKSILINYYKIVLILTKYYSFYNE